MGVMVLAACSADLNLIKTHLEDSEKVGIL